MVLGGSIPFALSFSTSIKFHNIAINTSKRKTNMQVKKEDVGMTKKKIKTYENEIHSHASRYSRPVTKSLLLIMNAAAAFFTFLKFYSCCLLRCQNLH